MNLPSDVQGSFYFLIATTALLTVGCETVAPTPSLRKFTVTGVVREVRPAHLVVAHDEIPRYMAAMTMPFAARDTNEIARLRIGDHVRFSFFVSEEESWIEQVVRTKPAEREPVRVMEPSPRGPSTNVHPLRSYKFTNELGQAVALGDFKGKALAITFFFTRCPVPDYCPRLSRNFQEVQNKLTARPGMPTNWHLISVTIDPEYDTPAVLKRYGIGYQYNPTHWSFLTGPKDKVAELMELSDVTVEGEGVLMSHNFRTLIIDPAGRLQMSFPIGGDISTSIADELVKATAANE